MNSGCSNDISVSPQGTNLIRLIVDGTHGILYVNGSLMGDLNLDDILSTGETRVMGSYYNNTTVSGMSTNYSNYKMWNLGVTE